MTAYRAPAALDPAVLLPNRPEVRASAARGANATRNRIADRFAMVACLALIVLPILADDTVRQFPTIAHDLGFLLFENWWKIAERAGATGVGWMKFNTIEALIAVTALATLVRWLDSGQRRLVVTPELVAVGAFLCVAAIMFAWGMATGGSFDPALWQVRPYVHIGAIGFLLPQVIRDRPRMRLAILAMLAAIVVKAVLVITVFVLQAHGQFSGWRELVGHEDSVFFGAAIAFMLAFALYKRGFRAKAVLFLAGPILLAALVLNLRRAGYVAFGMSMLLLPLLLDKKRRLAIAFLAVVAAAGALYAAAFWTDTGALGLPVEKVRSLFAASQANDYSSNMYRNAENLNLWFTVRDHPLGTGFGKPFEKPFPIADISATLADWDYHPHNAVFGLWMALGTPGFVILLWSFAMLLAAASFAIRQAVDPFEKATAVFCALSLAEAVLVGNFDQFIWTQRSALFVAAIIGFVAAMSAGQGRALGAFRGQTRPAGGLTSQT